MKESAWNIYCEKEYRLTARLELNELVMKRLRGWKDVNVIDSKNMKYLEIKKWMHWTGNKQ